MVLTKSTVGVFESIVEFFGFLSVEDGGFKCKKIFHLFGSLYIILIVLVNQFQNPSILEFYDGRPQGL